MTERIPKPGSCAGSGHRDIEPANIGELNFTREQGNVFAPPSMRPGGSLDRVATSAALSL